MPTLKGSQTEINLLTAFAGESQARNRYTYAASVAKKEGYVKVSNILLETADQEREHAKRLFKFLEGGSVTITAAYPAGKLSDTASNLISAAAGEHYEWTQMYPDFAKVAREEGFPAVAGAMESIAVAEKYHESRFNFFLEEIKSGDMFKKKGPVVWRCLNCGYLHEGPEAPDVCPACAHPQAHFESFADLMYGFRF